MDLFIVLLPTFILSFGASFLINIFKDSMDSTASDSNEVKPVEVINIGDFGRR
ncbi:hypothetical protein SAMN04487969_15516 [Paenibacillus algorifonticola]|uniref:Uncharacterized protein n=1 Tax=Paenibacillus algorifonticola TaxID=684063 RepID=A0A1I2J4W7_9BACL|nr:hypothetical protein SAMN04487969_15516 [Paenibacillus algorifonticola]